MRLGVRRLVRVSVIVLVAGAVVALSVQIPRALRSLETFNVRTVEVRGAHYTGPHEALEAGGLTRVSSVFDDASALRARLARHPMIEDAHIGRRLPGTLVITLHETQPIALAGDDMLRVVDAQGRLLPIDPASAPIDLPVITGVVGRAAVQPGDRLPGARRVAAELARLRRLEPALARRVSEASALPDGGIRLVLRAPEDAVALLPASIEPARLRELALTFGHLDRRNELARLQRIDARFREQIVVTLNPTVS